MLPVRQAPNLGVPPKRTRTVSSVGGEELARRFCVALLARGSSARVGAEWLAFPEPSSIRTYLLPYLLKFSKIVLTDAVSLAVRDDSLLLFAKRAHMSLSIHCNLSDEAQSCLRDLLRQDAFEVLHLRQPHRIVATHFKYNNAFEQAFNRVDLLDGTFRGMLQCVTKRRNALCDALEGALNLLLQMPGDWPDLGQVRATIRGFRV